MEPFRFIRDNDPARRTLLTSLRPSRNRPPVLAPEPDSGLCRDRQFHGRAVPATDAVMQPIIREAAKRGLGYLDDVPRRAAFASSVAAGQAMPFAKADFAIDACRPRPKSTGR